MDSKQTLGTLLRNLVDRLDHAVEQSYRDDGLDYRPRFTPVVRALSALGPSSITTLAQHIGMRHSAVSQTVAQMQRQGLVGYESGADARERLVVPSAALANMIPRLEKHWSATNKAAEALEDTLPHPLTPVLIAALEALDDEDFAARIARHFNAALKDGETP